MKKLSLALLLSIPITAMEPVSPNPVSKLPEQLADVIINLDNALSDDATRYKELLVEYFKYQSAVVEQRISPHLEKHLRDSDTKIKEILLNDDEEQLKSLIDKLVAQSIEDSFAEVDNQFDELKELADQRLTKTKYALATAVVGGLFSVLAVFFGAYFGR